jgi:hypothetical protein
MDILPLGELRIISSRIGLVRGQDGQPEVTRIHPNLLFAGGPRRLGGRYTSMERPDMSFLASSERAANGRLVFRPSFQASSFRRNPARACEGWHFASQSTRSASWPDYRFALRLPPRVDRSQTGKRSCDARYRPQIRRLLPIAWLGTSERGNDQSSVGYPNDEPLQRAAVKTRKESVSTGVPWIHQC